MRYEYWSRHAFRHVDAFLFRSQFLLSPCDFVFDLCDFSLSPAKWGPSADLLASAVMSSCEAPPGHLRGVQATVVAAISQHTQPCYSLHFWHFLFCLHTVWKEGLGDDSACCSFRWLSSASNTQVERLISFVPLTPEDPSPSSDPFGYLCACTYTHTNAFFTKVKYSILVDLVWFPLLN